MENIRVLVRGGADIAEVRYKFILKRNESPRVWLHLCSTSAFFSISLASIPTHSLAVQVYCRSAKLPETNAAVVTVRVPVKPLKVSLCAIPGHTLYVGACKLSKDR